MRPRHSLIDPRRSLCRPSKSYARLQHALARTFRLQDAQSRALGPASRWQLSGLRDTVEPRTVLGRHKSAESSFYSRTALASSAKKTTGPALYLPNRWPAFANISPQLKDAPAHGLPGVHVSLITCDVHSCALPPSYACVWLPDLPLRSERVAQASIPGASRDPLTIQHGPLWPGVIGGHRFLSSLEIPVYALPFPDAPSSPFGIG